MFNVIPMAVIWRAVDVAESPDVGHVLGDEADLVDRMVVQTILIIIKILLLLSLTLISILSLSLYY